MKTSIAEHVVHTSDVNWIPLNEEGIKTDGIYVKSLRYDEQQRRSPSVILKFEPGASYPYHNYPGGEEIFVLNGSCIINETKLSSGDNLFSPPGSKHQVKSETGCELLLIIPEEVEIL